MFVRRQFSFVASTGLRMVARHFGAKVMDRRIFTPNLKEFYDSSAQDFMSRLSSASSVVTLGTGESSSQVHIDAIAKKL